MKAMQLALCLLMLAIPAAAQPPNVVLIIGDDHGWPYSGFMGDPHAVTPNLDALAQQGTVFRNLHMMSATCVPSLRGLLGGIHPLQWTAATNAIRAVRGPIPHREEVEHFRTLPRELQRRGYAAWEGGKMWEGSFTQAGFTHGLATHIPFDPPGCAIFCSVGQEFGRTGIDPFRDFLDHVEGKPFFAWVAPMLPHAPFDAPAQYRAPYEGLGLAWYEIDYYANVTWLDAVVGEVVAELDTRGLRENTLIIYLSDNGWEIGSPVGFGKGKGTMYELGFRSPLIVNWAGHVPAGVTRDDLVAVEDVFTTVLDYAGAAPLADRDGDSLKPAIESGAPFGRDEVVTYYAATASQTGHVVRTSQWRYISFEGTNPREELYAIATDPYETVDVAAQQPALLAAFRDDVADFQARIASAPSPLEVTGRVVDAGGEPVSGLPVQLTTAGGTLDTVTTSGGWFDFDPVAHGATALETIGADADWFGIGPAVPVDVPVASLAPYVPLTVPGYQNPIGVGSHGKDPSVLVDGGAYYLFSSYTGDPALAGNIPLQRSTDLLSWEYLGDALPDLPAWVDPLGAEVRGPATLARPSLGRYLLYFSARHRDDGSPQSGRRCIGAVASAAPTMLLDGSASLLPDGAPLFCDTEGDVFDPFIFTAAAPSGDPYAWMIWVRHRDGEPDVIFNQLLQADGLTPAVPPFTMLTAETFPDLWENERLANPSVIHDPASNTYLLLYSANDPVYSVDEPTVTVIVGQPDPPAPQRYGANWATCPTAFGVFLPCTRHPQGPWLRSQNGAFRPGDAEVFRDTSGALWMLYDASARTAAFGAVIYHAPTLRLDRVCLGAGGVPRTTAPTTALQPTARSVDCAQDVQLLAEAWPEADQLFRQDPRWRGGDGAWSIDLGNERSLWIFGDSFIDPEGETRESSFFIRNSIAIQQGADPTTADMTFHWKTTAGGAPTAYFPNAGAIWYWGGAGAVIDSKLIVFQQGNQLDGGNVVRAPTKAVLIGNYTADPSVWSQQWFDVPPDPNGHIWGPHSAFTYGSHLYVYVTRPPAATGGTSHTAALVRFTKSNAKVGNFTKPQWWTGSQYVINGQPVVLWPNSTQYSVHALAGGDHLAIMGGTIFGPGLFATAPDRNGPFSPFETFFVQPESSWGGDGGGVLTYLWHAHPQVTGAPVVVTYSTHGFTVLQDESPYYPKFVRFTPP